MLLHAGYLDLCINIVLNIIFNVLGHFHWQHVRGCVTHRKGFNSLAACHKCGTALRIRPTVPAFNCWTDQQGFLGVRWRAELLLLFPQNRFSSGPIAQWLGRHSVMQRPKRGTWNVAERVPREPSSSTRRCHGLPWWAALSRSQPPGGMLLRLLPDM